MKIGVIGSGALGLYYGAMLQRAGHQVLFLLRSDYRTIKEQGLQVHSTNGDFSLPRVAGFQSAEQIGSVDLVLVGLKTFANKHLTELIGPLIGKETAILTLQNGLGNEELLAETFPAEQILGGVAFLCSNRGEPGHVHHLGEGRIRLGEFSGGLSPRSLSFAEMFSQAGVPCEAIGDLRKARWEKLIWNIPFNGMSALTEKNVNQLLAHPPSRSLIQKIMKEVVAAANAQQLSEPVNGEHFIDHMIHMTEKMYNYCPSMMIDRLEKRPLELTAIYAIPLQLAAQTGIPMPRTEMLYSLLELGEVELSVKQEED